MFCCPKCRNLNVVRLESGAIWCRNCDHTTDGSEAPRLAVEVSK